MVICSRRWKSSYFGKKEGKKQMKKLILRWAAGLMALFVAVSSLGGITTVSAAEETVLELTADMAEDGIITIKGGSWDKIVVPRTAGAKKILLNGVVTKSLVVESGINCTVEVSGGEIAAATVTPPQLEAIGHAEIVKMLEEGVPVEEVAQKYRSYTEEKEYLSKIFPTIVTKGKVDIKTVQVSGNVRLELGEGNVGGVKIDADGVQELLNVRIAGYGGKVDVEQKELPDGVWNVISLALDNSDLAELNIAGAKSSACHVEGWTSDVKKVEITGQTSLSMAVRAEEVRLDSKAENASLKVYSKVGNIIVEGNKNSVSLAASAKVEKAEVKGDNVKVYGSGQLDEADITGSSANVSTAGTKVEGENNNTPPAGLTPSSPSTPVRPVVTPTPKPEITPTPSGTPEPTPTPETDAAMFTYEVNEDGTVTVTGFSEAGSVARLTEISIPKLIEGKQVTHIGEKAFHERYFLKKVIFPEGLVVIGDSAFSYNYLSDVELPSTLRKIGRSAFLTYGAMEQGVLIPASVTEIGKSAFFGMLGDITAYEGSYAAQYAKENNIPLKLIGSGTISPSDIFTFVKDQSGIITVTGLKDGAEVSLDSLTIPAQISGGSVKEIGKEAFKGNEKLLGVKIASGIEIIYARAFADCGMLTSVDISATVKSIDGSAFANIGTKAVGSGSGSTPGTTGSVLTATGSTLTVTVIIRGDSVSIDETAFDGIPNVLFKVKKGSGVEAFLKEKNFGNIEYLPEE